MRILFIFNKLPVFTEQIERARSWFAQNGLNWDYDTWYINKNFNIDQDLSQGTQFWFLDMYQVKNYLESLKLEEDKYSTICIIYRNEWPTTAMNARGVSWVIAGSVVAEIPTTEEGLKMDNWGSLLTHELVHNFTSWLRRKTGKDIPEELDITEIRDGNEMGRKLVLLTLLPYFNQIPPKNTSQVAPRSLFSGGGEQSFVSRVIKFFLPKPAIKYPILGEVLPYRAIISQGFGPATFLNPVYDFHKGLDFFLLTGTEIIAVDSGKVIFVGKDIETEKNKGGYGYYIKIHHHFGISLYAHLSQIKVKKDEWVRTGQVIGLSGNSGFSTNPHLHFETRDNNNKAFDSISLFKQYQV